MTEAGDLRERLRFERRAPIADDGYGNTRTDWVLLNRMAARVAPARGGMEEVLAARLQGVGAFEITVRCCDVSLAFAASDRAVNERTGEIYNITAIDNPDEERQWLRLTARTGVASG